MAIMRALPVLILIITQAIATLLEPLHRPASAAMKGLGPTSHYARLTRLNHSESSTALAVRSYDTLIRPTMLQAQHVIEVQFNGIPRYLLLDTGSADIWMVAPGYQCLNVHLKPVPESDCAYGDVYTGPKIDQIANDTYYQAYGTGEIVSGPFRYASVTVAGLTVPKQQVALVDEGYLLGDHVRSGVVGLAPRPVTRAYTNDNSSTSPPNGTSYTYPPIFETMYKSGQIDPCFSLALQRGAEGGYIAFGGLPPINFTHEFASADFKGIPYLGGEPANRYYPIQPQSYELNGQTYNTSYRAIVDSGTAANRLPTALADHVNGAFDPPATYYPTLGLYGTNCNATAPRFGIGIGDRTFAINPADMFFPSIRVGDICATSITRGLEVPRQAYPEGFYILGDAFLNNVVAVFDVGNEQMHFAAHEDY